MILEFNVFDPVRLPIGELGDSPALFSFSFNALNLSDEFDDEQNDLK